MCSACVPLRFKLDSLKKNIAKKMSKLTLHQHYRPCS